MSETGKTPEAAADAPEPEPRAPEAPTPEAPAPAEVEASAATQPTRGAEAKSPGEETGAGAEASRPGCLRRLVRWGCRGLVLFVVLLVLARAALPWLLPGLLAGIGEDFRLKVDYERLELSALAGDLELRGLRVAPLEGGEAYLELPYLAVDIAVTELLALRATVERVEVDGLRLRVSRDAAGDIELITRLLAGLGPSEPEPEPEPEVTAESPDLLTELLGSNDAWDFSLPVALRSLAIRDLQVLARDELLAPPARLRLRADVWVSGLAFPSTQRPPRLDVALRCDPVLGRLRLRARGQHTSRRLSWTWSANLDELRFEPARAWIEPLGLAPDEGLVWSMRADGSLHLGAAVGAPGALDAGVEVNRLRVLQSAEREDAPASEAVGLDHFALRLGRLHLSEVLVDRVALEGLRARAERVGPRTLRFAGLEWTPLETEEDPAADDDPEPEAPQSAEGGAGVDLASLPRLRLDDLFVHGIDLGFRDAAVSPPAELGLRVPAVTLRDVQFGSRRTRKRSRFRAHIEAPGLFRELYATGDAQLETPEKTLLLRAQLSGLEPLAIAPYLEAAGIKSELVAGELKLERLRVGIRPLSGTALNADLELGPLTYRDGDEEFVGVDRILLDGISVDLATSSFGLRELRVERPRAKAGRSEDGDILAGGFRIAPPSDASAEAPQAPAAEPAAPAEPVSPDLLAGLPGFEVELGALVVEDGAARFDDASIAPVASFVVTDVDAAMMGFAVSSRSGAAAKAATIRGGVTVAGLVDRLTLDGSLTPALRAPALEVTVRGERLRTSALEPFLRGAGVSSALSDGALTLSASASAKLPESGILEAQAELEQLRLAQGAEVLASVDGVAVGLSGALRASPPELTITTLSLGTAQTAARLDERGRLHTLGLIVDLEAPRREAPAPKDARPDSPPEGEPTDTSAIDPSSWPLVRLPESSLGVLKLRIVDDRTAPGVPRDLELGASLGPIVYDPRAEAGEPGPFELRLRSPGIVDAVTASGMLRAAALSGAVEGQLEGRGIQTAPLRGYLDLVGVEATLKDGRFELGFAAEAGLSGDAPQRLLASARLSKGAFHGSGRQWLGLEELRVEGIAVAPGRIEVETLRVSRPLARVERTAEGQLEVLGLRLKPPPEEPEVEPEAPQESLVAGAPPEARPPARLPSARLGRFVLDSAELVWVDGAAPEAVELKPRVSATLAEFELRDEPRDTPLEVTITVPEVLEELTVKGPVRAGPKELRAALEVRGRGLRAGATAPYLPSSLEVTLADGRLGFDILAEARLGERGRLAAALSVRDFDYREADSDPFASFDVFEVRAPTLDLEGGDLRFQAVRFQGFKARAEREPGGALALLGMRLTPAAEDPEAGAAELPEAGAAEVAAKPPTRRRRSRLLRRIKQQSPLITIEDLDLGIAEFRLKETSPEGPVPITLADLRLKNTGAIELFGARPELRPPLKLQLSGAIAPVVSSIDIRFVGTPSAINPDLDIELVIDGIRGQAVTRILKGKGSPVKAVEFERGRLVGHVHVGLHGAQRAGPLDMSFLERPFGLELELKGWALSDGEREWLGLEDLLVDAKRIDLAAQQFRIARVEVNGPFAWLRKDKDGLRAAGLLLDLEPKEAPREDAPPRASSPSGDEVRSPKPAPAEAPKPLPDLQIESIVVRETRIDAADRSTRPPALAPLNIELVKTGRFTTAMLTERLPLDFEVRATGSQVPLPAAAGQDLVARGEQLVGWLTGAVKGVAEGAGSVVSAVTPGSIDLLRDEAKPPPDLSPADIETEVIESKELERRAFLEEARIRGQVILAQPPAAQVRIEVDELELPTFRGPAQAAGVILRQGTASLRATIELDRDGTLKVDERLRLTDLVVEEEAGGPIQSALKVTTPTGTVIFLLRDEDGTVSLPAEITLPQGQVSASQLSSELLRRLGELIARSVANAPLRATKGALGEASALVEQIPGTQFIPWLGTKEPPKLEPVTLSFDPGSAALSPESEAALEVLAGLLKEYPGLRLEVDQLLGTRDVDLVGRRANPPKADVEALLARMTRRRRELSALRVAEARRAREAYALGLVDEARGRWEALGAIDEELGELLRATRTLHDQISPRGLRRSGRRLAEAARQLGRERQRAASAILEARGVGEELSQRVKMKDPKLEVATDALPGRLIVTPKLPKGVGSAP